MKLTKAQLQALVKAGAKVKEEKAPPPPRRRPRPRPVPPSAPPPDGRLRALEQENQALRRQLAQRPRAVPASEPPPAPPPPPPAPQVLSFTILRRDGRGRLEALTAKTDLGEEIKASVADRDSYGNLQALVLQAEGKRQRIEVTRRSEDHNILEARSA